MNISSTDPIVNATTQTKQGSVAQAAQLMVLKRAMDIQESGAAELLKAVPTLATDGSLGTKLDTFA